MAVMAQQHPDHEFTVLDESEDRIAKWDSEDAPIHEPGLSDILKEVRALDLGPHS